ncbi:MAG: hypothetical protein F6J97_11360 [Leptolyngbya sp. SIO4C1]|nr:hypothetical protein [Leptolyngbya sp. SIO4C1]
MSNSTLHAFFVGRALATAIGEQVEHLVTDGLSQLGKFDAEQRDNLRRFTEEVFDIAQQTEVAADVQSGTAAATVSEEDLQAVIDHLRAEIAQVRVALQQYRTP